MSEQAHQDYSESQTPEKNKIPQDIATMFSNIASQVPEEVYGLGTMIPPYILHEDPEVGAIGICYWGNHQFLMRAWPVGDTTSWVQKMFEYRFDAAHHANRLVAVDQVLEYGPTARRGEYDSTGIQELIVRLHDGFHELRQQVHDNVIPLLGATAQQGMSSTS